MERDAIAVAERQGHPARLRRTVDLDDDPHIARGRPGLISLGHDEYWSRAHARAVEAARDGGTNLAFLGANAVYWRIRFARTPLGVGRLVVCGKDDAEDPGTRLWREDEPESSLTGPMYDCFPAEAAYVVYDPGRWIFKGTGVRRGTAFPGMAGVETDKVFSGVPRPMEILSISPLNCGGRSTVAHSAYYTVPGGAAVFAPAPCAGCAPCAAPAAATASPTGPRPSSAGPPRTSCGPSPPAPPGGLTRPRTTSNPWRWAARGMVRPGSGSGSRRRTGRLSEAVGPGAGPRSRAAHGVAGRVRPGESRASDP